VAEIDGRGQGLMGRVCCAAGALMAMAAAAAGCGGDSKDEGSERTATVREASAGERGPTAPGASVAFVVPKSGSTTGATVRARVRLTNFELEPGAVGEKPEPGHGHLRFALDGGRYDRPPWSPRAAAGPLASKLHSAGKYTPAVTPSVTYRRIPKGRHRLLVFLSNNDGTNTDIGATTIFTVK
jgi:hypothetical protein